jgi:hypothetical protein
VVHVVDPNGLLPGRSSPLGSDAFGGSGGADGRLLAQARSRALCSRRDPSRGSFPDRRGRLPAGAIKLGSDTCSASWQSLSGWRAPSGEHREGVRTDGVVRSWQSEREKLLFGGLRGVVEHHLKICRAVRACLRPSVVPSPALANQCALGFPRTVPLGAVSIERASRGCAPPLPLSQGQGWSCLQLGAMLASFPAIGVSSNQGIARSTSARASHSTLAASS